MRRVPLAWPHAPRPRGAALLLAMVILTLVATLAAGMVWQHARAIQVEGAERSRLQSTWVLHGALDWARLILREDGRNRRSPGDHLGEPWAVPLAEARLSTFLAADRSGTTTGEDDGPEAFLSGSIVDAQSFWNLTNVLATDANNLKLLDVEQMKILQSLCDAAGVPSDTAQRLSDGLLRAWTASEGAALMPRTMRELTWLGLDGAVVTQLESLMTLLPTRTPLNVNTASSQVLAAAVPGGSAGWAQGILEQRQRKAFESIDALGLSPAQKEGLARLGANGLDVKTNHFFVRGRLRLDQRVLEEVSLVRRDPNNFNVEPLSHQRLNALEGVAR